MEAIQSLKDALAELAGHKEVRAGLREALTPLAAYDARRGTDLLLTLTSYVRYGGSIATTAEALFVHRNSVLYRLQRIEEVAGIDARNARVREALLIGLVLAGDDLLDELQSGPRRYDNAG